MLCGFEYFRQVRLICSVWQAVNQVVTMSSYFVLRVCGISICRYLGTCTEYVVWVLHVQVVMCM